MLKLFFFIGLLPFAMMEIFFYNRFGIVVVCLLYFLLSFQADRAANRLFSDGFRWRIPTRQSERRRGLEEESEQEEIEVVPLGNPRNESTTYSGQPCYYTAMRTDPKPEETPAEAVKLSRPSAFRLQANRPAEPGRLPEAPKNPNYRGRAHEVLAVPENAATRTIKRAFRFWIKKVHPDHNGSLPDSLANLRVQRITEAKDLLLERRRTRKGAA